MAKQVSPGVLALRKVVDDVHKEAREAKARGELLDGLLPNSRVSLQQHLIYTLCIRRTRQLVSQLTVTVS